MRSNFQVGEAYSILVDGATLTAIMEMADQIHHGDEPDVHWPELERFRLALATAEFVGPSGRDAT